MRSEIKGVIGCLLLFALSMHAQYSRGVVHEGLTVSSKILGKTVRYTVYLPYDYDTSTRYYPVVYLLHGYGDNDMGWIQFGEAHLTADQAIGHGEIAPMILVMPDGGVSWYINNFDGRSRYEDFFFQEFMPAIESKYRIRAEKRYRGVAGLSMGGYGSLVYALKHPDLFSACAAFSAGVRTHQEIVSMPADRWDRMEGLLYGPGLEGEDRLTPGLLSNDVFHLLETGDIEKMKSVRFYVDCGDDDFLYRGNSSLHMLMRDKGLPHEYRVREGGHIWEYWRTGLPEGLKFISTSFHQQ